MKKVFYFLFLASILFVTSCKKSSGDDTTDKIVGKWNLKSYSTREIFNSVTYTDSDTYPAGNYLQFDGKGKCIVYVDNEVTSTTYELLDNGNTLWIKDDGTLDLPEAGFTIQKLTGSELELYSKEVEISSTYEITIYLSK